MQPSLRAGRSRASWEKHCGSLSTRKPTEPRLCRQLQDQHRLEALYPLLTQVERISKKTILAAGLRPELTFTSLGRHGGATETNTSGRTETQLMTKGQWSSTAAMGNYLHDDDEGKQDAQMKRMKRRAKYSKG